VEVFAQGLTMHFSSCFLQKMRIVNMKFRVHDSSMTPNGNLGEVIKKEQIQTSIANAHAWRK
jgi:hypothetical protein